ncbi:putative orphan protein; putative membrane protein [Reinekea sp. MED297]|uniref:Putative orphan protein putative membrane protein n=2 Tax=Reinekea TaxID=230494 RepID=A4BH06_9GAMM|nr:putative orphan protein; putative membrane protein [Reinekea sp. MED297] [Reinekea blandensis MED297]
MGTLLWTAQTPFENHVWIALFFLVLVAVLFSSLTIKVDDQSVVWYFGPRFWKKKIALSDIKAVAAVATKWYWGYGIRLTPEGWLYTVSGLSAVKVELHSGQVVLLGSTDVNGLMNALGHS